MSDLSNSNVLVVDDTETNIDILVETLGDAYDVSVAMDGESALEDIAERAPDLILLDIMMPGMDGYEVCEKLKKDDATKNIPVIFLTAMTEAQDEAKGLALGAVDYITKPFGPELVKSRVRNQLELKRHRDNLEELVRERTM
jgi:putative two-component system response regulator